MENAQFYTYLHCRPDLTPFYVGKGQGNRSHDFARRNQHHKSIVAKYGRENIQIIVTKKDSEESAFKSEIRLIKMMRWAGFELCNYTDGGDGASGAMRSLATREKLSDALRGKKKSPEHCKNIGLCSKGRKLSTEQRAALIVANTGRKHSSEEKAKRVAALKIKLADLEVRAKMSASQVGNKKGIGNKNSLGKKHSQAARDKMSAAGRGKKKSDETRAKMSASMKIRMSNPEYVAKIIAARSK